MTDAYRATSCTRIESPMRPRFVPLILSLLLSVCPLPGITSSCGLARRALGGAEEPKDHPTSTLVEKLTSLLETQEGKRFWVAVSRLEGLGSTAIPSLRAKLSAPGEKTRLGCAKALLEIGDLESRREALETIARLAKGANSSAVQIDAIQIFGLKEDPDVVVPVLEELLEKTKDPGVTIPLARTLWEVDHISSARDRLVELLQSRDVEVRTPAALTLAELGYFEGPVRGILRSLKDEPTPRGRQAAALYRIMRLSRQLESRLTQGELLLDGTDPAKLLQIKEQRIRELEDQVERMIKGGASAPSRRPDSVEDELLEEVIEYIQKAYVDEEKVSRDQLLLRAVKGMVRSLDEHSVFMEAEVSRNFEQVLKGTYAGIGAQVSKPPEGPLEIVRPFYGGPAYRQGIHSGDRVLEVDGLSTTDLEIDELVDLLKGEKGSTVTVKIWRRGWAAPRDFKIKRETVEVPSVYRETLPGDIGYIRLTQFGDTSADDFIAQVSRLEEQRVQGLILDLRGNGGGRLDAAVRITDLFVDNKLPIVQLKGRPQEGNGEGVESIHGTPDARKDYPIVVLVDKRSASASEVLAGALQDHGRATILGERTYGKGSVQKLLPLNTKPACRLKLTVQYYFLPLGRCIHTVRDERGRVVTQGGVEPNVVVKPQDLPEWRQEARATLRGNPKVLDYVDEHWGALEKLALYGGRGSATDYPELAKLQESLKTEATEDDVRVVVRYHVRRRVEDRRGREIPFDFQDDNVLQRGVLELLSLMNRRAEDFPEYRWLVGQADVGGSTAENAAPPKDDAAARDN